MHITFAIMVSETRKTMMIKEAGKMKGYTTDVGYMGYVDGTYMLFASEKDYLEFLED